VGLLVLVLSVLTLLPHLDWFVKNIDKSFLYGRKDRDMDRRLEVIIASLTIASVVVAVLLYTVPMSANQTSSIYIFDFIVVIILADDFCIRI
jgi:hypothetical protein